MNYVVFDFETTGFSPINNEIIQIGAVKFDENHEQIGQINQLVKPVHSFLSQKISELTGIQSSDLTNAPIISEVLPTFLEFVKDCLLIAHNAKFDLSFLTQAIEDCQLESPNFEVYDTYLESKNLLKRKSYKLESFKDELEIAELRSHDALNDCLITAKLYQHLLTLSKPVKKEKVAVKSDEQLDLFEDFAAETDEITEEIRRKLGLPITKALIYFGRDEAGNWEKHDLAGLTILQDYSTGFSVNLRLANDKNVRIHSDFLKEMQKANFTEVVEND